MFDFLTGFLFGIVFTIGATVFGIYKLLLKFGEEPSTDRQLQPYSTSLSRIHYTPPKTQVKHSIRKHTLDEAEVNIETCIWLNTIAASICVEALSSPMLVESLHNKLHEILNKPEDKPDILGKIVISDINMGTGLPLVDGIRVLSRSHDDSLNAEIGIRYNGGASFTISTELWINWPTPRFASLPVSLQASFEQFEGTLTTACHLRSDHKTRFSFFFRNPPTFQLRIGSTIGHTTKLVNVLQISSLLENMIYSFVNKELVAPNGFEVELEDGKVSVIRKLSNIPTATTIAKLVPETRGTEKVVHGDLSRRSFSVST